MNREETKEAIKVMIAWVDGENIEFNHNHNDNNWRGLGKEVYCAWDWFEFKYRIKPKPEPTIWGYPISRLRGAWVKMSNEIMASIDIINPRDTQIMVGKTTYSFKEAGNVFEIIHETVRPEEKE